MSNPATATEATLTQEYLGDFPKVRRLFCSRIGILGDPSSYRGCGRFTKHDWVKGVIYKCRECGNERIKVKDESTWIRLGVRD